jgi:arabinan endo-1,5-alpha-L-arabinosidase
VFGDNQSCITHLTADRMTGPWTDHGPIICTVGNESYNAIDADVELDADGTPWFAFGSFWDGIYGFKLNADGSRATDDTTMHHLAWNSSIEAPVLFRRCGWYYLFVSWGACCQGANSTYNVRVGRSESIMGPYVDKNGTPMTDGGGTLMVEGGGDYAAAGHSEVLVDGDTIYHLYHAYTFSGNPYATLRIAQMPFDSDGWPVRTAGP